LLSFTAQLPQFSHIDIATMSNDIDDVSAAIDILIRFIRGYDKVVAEDFSLLLNPITRGDIHCGITVLKRRLCQATDHEATDHEATDHEATDHGVTDHGVTDHEATDRGATDQDATDQEATDQEATDHEATDHEATDHEATDHEATDHEATDHEATDHEATDHEATTDKETEIQKILRDPESKLIFESFSVDEKSATAFIASYGANPERFWNKLPMLMDGDIVMRLFKLLENHSAMSDLTQRLLEIKLYEQVQLLEREFIETSDEPGRGRTPKSKALKRALGHKASRAEEYKVDRGKKLSNFEFIDLFRISKPHWRKWVNFLSFWFCPILIIYRWRYIELEKVEMISRNLQPVEAEWAEDLSAVLSRVYQCLPSQTTRDGATRIQDSELEDPIIPSPNFRTPEDPADSHADSLGSRYNETLDRELISSPAETIISNKRPASDLCPAAKRQRLEQVTPPSQVPDLQNDRTVQPSNDDSARRGGLDVSPLRDFGAQPNPAVAQGRFQLFQAQTRSREPSLAAVVDDSISPDQLDAIIASAEHRVPWPGMASCDDDPDLDAIIASAEHRVPWPTGITNCGADRDLDAIIASAEHRVPWPGMASCDDDPDLDAIIASAEHRVPWSGGAYQWPLPNQHRIAAT
jgi:hypothetical protein